MPYRQRQTDTQRQHCGVCLVGKVVITMYDRECKFIKEMLNESVNGIISDLQIAHDITDGDISPDLVVQIDIAEGLLVDAIIRAFDEQFSNANSHNTYIVTEDCPHCGASNRIVYTPAKPNDFPHCRCCRNIVKPCSLCDGDGCTNGKCPMHLKEVVERDFEQKGGL